MLFNEIVFYFISFAKKALLNISRSINKRLLSFLSWISSVRSSGDKASAEFLAANLSFQLSMNLVVMPNGLAPSVTL